MTTRSSTPPSTTAPSSVGDRDRGPRHPAGPPEGIGRGACLRLQRLPGVLADRDRRALDRLGLDEVRREPARERLDRPVQMLGREGVDGVLHRVGGDDERVVAGGERGVEAALQRDVDGEVADTVDRPANDPDEPDRLLAVAVGAELGHVVSTESASMRRTTRRAASRRYAAVDRTSSIGRMALPSAVDRRLDALRGRAAGPRARPRPPARGSASRPRTPARSARPATSPSRATPRRPPPSRSPGPAACPPSGTAARGPSRA